MYVIYSKESMCSVNKIDEDTLSHYELNEDTAESRKEAKESGYKFAHLFVQHDDGYNHSTYTYFTSESL